MVKLEEIHDILMRMTFPATRESLIEQAVHMEASDAVLQRLRALPEHYYGSADTVMDALRGLE